MKLLYCEECGDIVAPSRKAYEPRWCSCGRHAVWWINPLTGVLRLHDRLGRYHEYGEGLAQVDYPRAFVIGLHNGLFRDDDAPVTTKAHVTQEIENTPENYIFKRAGSLVIKLRPNMSNDTSWAKSLPLSSEGSQLNG
jgi:hypothetical protein